MHICIVYELPSLCDFDFFSFGRISFFLQTFIWVAVKHSMFENNFIAWIFQNDRTDF